MNNNYYKKQLSPSGAEGITVTDGDALKEVIKNAACLLAYHKITGKEMARKSFEGTLVAKIPGNNNI